MRSLLVTVHLFAFTLALITLSGGPASAEILAYEATLSGGAEVPPVVTTASGSATLTVDTVTREADWTLEFQGLSSAQTGAHFHYGAIGVAGTLLEPLPLRTPAGGTWTLTAQELAWLTGGEMYVNVHTLNHVGGEIRGQLHLAGTVDDEQLTLGALKALFR